MDPGDVLMAAGDRATDARSEEREHLRERSPVGREHHARAGHRHPAVVGRGERLLLPGADDFGQEVVSGGGGLVDPLGLARAVVARCRLRHEDMRPDFVIEPA